MNFIKTIKIDQNKFMALLNNLINGVYISIIMAF